MWNMMYKMLFKLVDFTCGETVNQGAGARFLQPVLQALPPLEEKPHRLCVCRSTVPQLYSSTNSIDMWRGMLGQYQEDRAGKPFG